MKMYVNLVLAALVGAATLVLNYDVSEAHWSLFPHDHDPYYSDPFYDDPFYDDPFYDDPFYDDPYYDDDYYYDPYYEEGVLFHCAPSDVQGNVERAERALIELAHSSEFKDARRFKAIIDKVHKVRAFDKKVYAYFSMLDIDASDNAEVAEFLGARTPKVQWLNALEKNADLNRSQASQVVKKLSSTLRGGLR